MIAVRLTPDLKMLAVASPGYLARRAVPHTPGRFARPRVHQLASSG